MSGSQINSTATGNGNKFYNSKQRDSLDRTLWEMRSQYRQYYRNHTPNSQTPSSTVLNSPIFDDIKFIDQYQKVTSDSAELAGNGLCVLNSSQNEGASNFYLNKDNVVFDEVEDTRSTWMNSHYGNRLVTGFSPTSSQSSHSAAGSDGSNSKNRIIGDIQIADLQQSPRRLGTTHSNGQQSPIDPTAFMEKVDKNHHFHNSQRLQLHSPVTFPKRAPGFPKVSLLFLCDVLCNSSKKMTHKKCLTPIYLFSFSSALFHQSNPKI